MAPRPPRCGNADQLHPLGLRRSPHRRSRAHRPDILTFLLDCGFDPIERVSGGEGDWVAYSQGYPLWTSAALGRRELAEILLTRGADPNVHVDSRGSAVHSAYSHKQWEMVDG